MFRKFRQFCCCLFCGFFCFPILFKYKLLKIEKGKVVLAWTSASTYSVVAVSFVIWSLVRVQLWRNKLNWPNKQKTRWWEVIRKKKQLLFPPTSSNSDILIAQGIMEYIRGPWFAGYFPSELLQVAPRVPELCEGCQHLLRGPPAQLFTPSAPHTHSPTLALLLPHHCTGTTEKITHLSHN